MLVYPPVYGRSCGVIDRIRRGNVRNYRPSAPVPARMAVSRGVDNSVYAYGPCHLYRRHPRKGKIHPMDGAVRNNYCFKLCVALFVFQSARLYAVLFVDTPYVGGGICPHAGAVAKAKGGGSVAAALYGVVVLCGVSVLWNRHAKLITLGKIKQNKNAKKLNV